MPGMGLIVKSDGNIIVDKIMEPKERRACSFERIYFSRGSDERSIAKETHWDTISATRSSQLVNHDLKNTIFSFIPNTAEVAFFRIAKRSR